MKLKILTGKIGSWLGKHDYEIEWTALFLGGYWLLMLGMWWLWHNVNPIFYKN